jgi:hypothetical protein
MIAQSKKVITLAALNFQPHNFSISTTQIIVGLINTAQDTRSHIGTDSHLLSFLRNDHLHKIRFNELNADLTYGLVAAFRRPPIRVHLHHS